MDFVDGSDFFYISKNIFQIPQSCSALNFCFTRLLPGSRDRIPFEYDATQFPRVDHPALCVTGHKMK
jgi:hypothetical protein